MYHSLKSQNMLLCLLDVFLVLLLDNNNITIFAYSLIKDADPIEIHLNLHPESIESRADVLIVHSR